MNNGMTIKRFNHIRDHIHLLELDLAKGKILNRDCKSLSTKGYLRTRLAGKLVMQHQVFAVARWGEKCIGLTVNHKNEVKTDNSWNNLELLTNEENIKARTKAGTGFVSKIKCINLETKEELVFDSQNEASRKLKVSQGNINMILSGIRKSTLGWTFERVGA